MSCWACVARAARPGAALRPAAASHRYGRRQLLRPQSQDRLSDARPQQRHDGSAHLPAAVGAWEATVTESSRPSHQPGPEKSLISLVIPALNEAANIPDLLD